MDFTAWPAVVCTCGHDLMITQADPSSNDVDTYNFLGHCANEGVCDTPDWTISITAAEPAVQTAARKQRLAEREGAAKAAAKPAEAEPEKAKR